jgi:hypothetical protein
LLCRSVRRARGHLVANLDVAAARRVHAVVQQRAAVRRARERLLVILRRRSFRESVRSQVVFLIALIGKYPCQIFCVATIVLAPSPERSPAMRLLRNVTFVADLRFCRAFLLLALCCLACLSAVSTRADSFPPPVFLPPSYQVSGALLIVGNDVCSGLPCTETIAFSFDFGYATFSGEPGYFPYVSNLLATGTGALPFTDSFTGPGFLNPNEGVFLALGGPTVSEFDIFFFAVFCPCARSARALCR